MESFVALEIRTQADSYKSVYDHSGNNHHGANAVFDEDRFVDGWMEKAFFFDGNDYISDIPGLGNALFDVRLD